MSNITTEFHAAVTSHLERLTPALVPVLRQLISQPYPPEVVHIRFEVFCDGFTDEFPVRAFFMDAENGEHFVYVNGKAEYPSAVDSGLLKIEGVYPASFEEPFEERDPNFDYMTEAGKALVPWFAKCWLAAGGATFALGASIGLHDGWDSYDLVRGEWSEEPS